MAVLLSEVTQVILSTDMHLCMPGCADVEGKKTYHELSQKVLDAITNEFGMTIEELNEIKWEQKPLGAEGEAAYNEMMAWMKPKKT